MNEVQEQALEMLTALVNELEEAHDPDDAHATAVAVSTVVAVEKFAFACNLAGAGQEYLDKVAAQAARLHQFVA